MVFISTANWLICFLCRVSASSCSEQEYGLVWHTAMHRFARRMLSSTWQERPTIFHPQTSSEDLGVSAMQTFENRKEFHVIYSYCYGLINIWLVGCYWTINLVKAFVAWTWRQSAAVCIILYCNSFCPRIKLLATATAARATKQQERQGIKMF